jgi:LPS sulfotransferase NodH
VIIRRDGSVDASIACDMTDGDSEILRGYAICTVPRSGSNWLGQLLASTGLLGNPLEYFNGVARRLLTDPLYPDDPQQQVARILTTGRSANGIYGFKLFAPQFQQIEGKVSLSRDLPNLRFILLRRQDVLRQAISWVRALQTNQYRASQPVQGGRDYDRAFILDRIRHRRGKCTMERVRCAHGCGPGRGAV